MAVSQKSEENGFKEYTDIIGGSGWFQIVICIFCFFCAAAHCLHDFTMTFFAPNMDHWCARPPEVLRENVSVEEWKKLSIPLWDLVCDREWLISMSKTVFMVAFLISSSMSGQISDRLGRRKVFLACLCLFLVFALLTLLCTNIIMLMVFRFFMSLGMTSVYVNCPVLLSEIVGAEYRTTYCFGFKFGWTFAYMLMPYIAWLVPSWFWMHLTFTVPWLFLLSGFCIIKETPRWLLTKRRFDELEELLLYAAKKNGKNMKQAASEIKHYIGYHSQMKHKENEDNVTVLDMLRTPGLRKNSIIIYYSIHLADCVTAVGLVSFLHRYALIAVQPGTSSTDQKREEVTYPWVPMAIPGALSIVGGFLVLLLPETKDKILPDTLDEGEKFARKQYIDCPSENSHNFSKDGEANER
ncbi:hypothetical protein TNIN_285521 [Trichonephila inaurata madagascariensis]|uniref:Major facilitator superfamily (MFS) profile domain-containing protein n=1 Tax=Trichonephila inaurata madagascariensis TaxID=2747483 RepID=A0A8X6Y0I9_9ARAC|nr:hypothetical protein TNIN_285521 [Trichonephila inaurata madagascariensis]